MSGFNEVGSQESPACVGQGSWKLKGDRVRSKLFISHPEGEKLPLLFRLAINTFTR
jgi:hypothetical protein